MSRKKVLLKISSKICMILLIFIAVGLVFPTWPPKVKGENSISELREVEVNGEDIHIGYCY